MKLVLILIIISLYILSIYLSYKIADCENPESYWYCGDDYGAFIIVVLFFCFMPFINILMISIGSNKFNRD